MFENMTPLEKVLTKVVGLLVPVVILFMVFFWFMSKLERNDNELAQLRRNLTTATDVYDNAQLAKQRQGYYQELSLPSDPRFAKLEFNSWLENAVAESGLTLGNRNSPTGGILKSNVGRGTKVAIVVPRTLTMTGTLDQMVEFLHKFYSLGAIKRISKLSMSPMTVGGQGKDKFVRSGKFKFVATVEAVSLTSAEKEKSVGEFPVELVRSLEEYRIAISQRNIFSPANNVPNFSVRDQSFDEGDEIAFSIEAKDADDRDEIGFEVVSPSIEGAVIESSEGSRRGSFKCPPQPIGDYVVGVRVFDNGNPSKDFTQEVKFTVNKKPNKYPSVTTKSFDVYVGEPIDVEILGSDADGDIVTMEMVNSEDFPDAKFEMVEGESVAVFSHPPFEETGKKRFELKLSDGKPPKMRRDKPVDNIASITVNIKPPKFLKTEFTKITSINQVDGVDQAWINVRPDNVTHVVSAGDSFDLDRQKWIVKSVSVQEGLVVFDVDDEIKTFKFPCFLNECLEDEDKKGSRATINRRSSSQSSDDARTRPGASGRGSGAIETDGPPEGAIQAVEEMEVPQIPPPDVDPNDG